MIEAPVFGANGKKSGTLALPADYFDGTVNEPVMHQAVKVFLSNQRQGTHSTKTRRWVTGGNQKPWKQKGTGRARQGTTRAPHWPGGGVAFGPHPRDYTQDMPKKQKHLARRSAFNARAREGALLLVDSADFGSPKTAKLAGLLEAMGLEGKKVLILTHGIKKNVYLSGRNLPTVDVMPFADAATYHVLWSDTVVIERGAFTDELAAGTADLADDAPAPKPANRPAAKKTSTRKTTATTAAAPKARAEKKAPVKKAATPKAEKKAPAKKAPAKKAAPKKKGSE